MLALLLVGASLTAAQVRCKLSDVRQQDGSVNLGRCDELSLFGEKVGDAGIAAVAKALSTNTNLKLLDLWSNDIGPAGAASIAEALSQNNAMQKLFLNENPLGPAGVKLIAGAMRTNRGLQMLWLSDCGLGDEGASILAAMLDCSNRKVACAARLETLDIWNNSITHVGASAIAKALQGNTMLRTLEMRNNKIGDLGAKEFTTMMPHNWQLQTLDLISNGMSDVGKDALVKGLASSTARPYLVLFADGLPHQQATSWEQQGKPNAP